MDGRIQNHVPVSWCRAILGLIGPLFVTGCGKTLKVEPFGEFVSRFEAYSEKYSGERIKVDNLIIEFAKSGEKPAHCDSALFKTPKIFVNSELWQTQSADSQEMVMLHELGHCVLGRKHMDDKAPSEERPRSLMATELVDQAVFGAYREQYLTELFSLTPLHPFPSSRRP